MIDIVGFLIYYFIFLQILDTYKETFGSSYPIASTLSPVLVSPTKLTIGEVCLERLRSNDNLEAFSGKDLLLILRDQQPALKSLALCVQMGWMAILASYNEFLISTT